MHLRKVSPEKQVGRRTSWSDAQHNPVKVVLDTISWGKRMKAKSLNIHTFLEKQVTYL